MKGQAVPAAQFELLSENRVANAVNNNRGDLAGTLLAFEYKAG